MSNWVDVCATTDVEVEDLITVTYNGMLFAIYRSPDGSFFATDGRCTHEDVDLGDGLVEDYVIECPKHNARFDYCTGEVQTPPACVNLRTYQTRLNEDRVEILVE